MEGMSSGWWQMEGGRETDRIQSDAGQFVSVSERASVEKRGTVASQKNVSAATRRLFIGCDATGDQNNREDSRRPRPAPFLSSGPPNPLHAFQVPFTLFAKPKISDNFSFTSKVRVRQPRGSITSSEVRQWSKSTV